jgi:hypothetical protein
VSRIRREAMFAHAVSGSGVVWRVSQGLLAPHRV